MSSSPLPSSPASTPSPPASEEEDEDDDRCCARCIRPPRPERWWLAVSPFPRRQQYQTHAPVPANNDVGALVAKYAPAAAPPAPPAPHVPAPHVAAPHAAPKRPMFCINCGASALHMANRCPLPILSYGAIAYRDTGAAREYLMICRRHTLGFMDFMRGRLPRVLDPLAPPPQIAGMVAQMTRAERVQLLAFARDPATCARDRVALWLAAPHSAAVVEALVCAADADPALTWTEPEWGFPKGKRNTLETDRACALREFAEETGMPVRTFTVVSPPHAVAADPWPLEARCAANIMGRALRETFRGSNYKTYCHRYLLLAAPPHADALPTDNYQRCEVSDMQWFSLADACAHMRPYNTEKRALLVALDAALDAQRAAAAAAAATHTASWRRPPTHPPTHPPTLLPRKK